MALLIQKGDLNPSSFSNDNTANQGGITVRTDNASDVGQAIAAAMAALPADKYVMGASFSGTTLTLTRSGGLPDINIDLGTLSDGVVTNAYMTTDSLVLDRSGGLPSLTVDLSQFIDPPDGVITELDLLGTTLVAQRSAGLPNLTADLQPVADVAVATLTAGAVQVRDNSDQLIGYLMPHPLP